VAERTLLTETVVEAFVSQALASLVLTSSINHPGESGRAREEVLRQFLAALLPAGLRLDTGFVVDAQGSVSRQIDLILYRDDYHPVFTVGGIRHVMVEAVIAVVENKARITSRKVLREALANVASVKRLDRSNGGFNMAFPRGGPGVPVDPARFEHQVLGIIVTQRSMRRKALLPEWHAYLASTPRSLWPNLYVDVHEFDIAYAGERSSATTTDCTHAQTTATRINGVPLADLAFELANWTRVSPLIDYRASSYFGLAGGLGGAVINRPIVEGPIDATADQE
jgi:hypothetical protein